MLLETSCLFRVRFMGLVGTLAFPPFCAHLAAKEVLHIHMTISILCGSVSSKGLYTQCVLQFKGVRIQVYRGRCALCSLCTCQIYKYTIFGVCASPWSGKSCRGVGKPFRLSRPSWLSGDSSGFLDFFSMCAFRSCKHDCKNIRCRFARHWFCPLGHTCAFSGTCETDLKYDVLDIV